MSSSPMRPAERSAAIALCLILIGAAIATLAAANAQASQAAQFKMVACATTSGAPPYTTETNTVSAQHPNGIFDFSNYCGGAGGDPPGDSAFLRISEHEPSGNAGYGSYGRFVFNTPAYVHFVTGGSYTREPNAFNAGWLARFRVLDFSNNTTTTLNQGAGLPNNGVDFATTGSFAPHLWPFGYPIDFHHFYYELVCNLPGGCDRANYNAVDANAFAFILNDDQAPNLLVLAQESGVMQGKWVSGSQWIPWYVQDNGSGLRNERVLIDGQQRYLIDHQAQGECNATASTANGEFSRNFQPCPTGPFWHSYSPDTASLSDGGHELSVCVQDYGQYRGLNSTGGWSCDNRTIHVDNHAPGAPAGLQVISANPNRYLDRFGARFTLPPDTGSPVAKVHYEITDAAGKVLGSEQTISGTNPTEIPAISGPQKAGDYRLKVWLEDSVGLIGPPATAPIPHDTTPPAAPQEVSVTAPGTSRIAQGFDVRWRDIPDVGSPLEAAHYEVLGSGGQVLVPAQTIEGGRPETIDELQTPQGRGASTLRVWLSDAEGNTGAPASVPLSYECVRSEVGGGLRLDATLEDTGLSEAVLSEGESSAVGGSLRGASAIAGAPICVFGRVVTDQEARFLGIALTGAEGQWRFALDPGPSREILARYRPGQRELTATATVLTRVRPTFSVARKVVRNGGFARFSGTIPGPHNDSVVVVLQVKSGKGWRAFRRYRTRAGGRFAVPYRFTRTTTASTYVMRAQVRSQAGYPYLQGNSRPIALRVLPARPGR